MYRIYHNPRCRKSRAGLQYLQEKGVEIEIVEYMKDPITEDVLKDLLVRLNRRPLDMVRTQEDIYRKELKGRKFTDDEWVKIMVENPRLIQRPIVVKGPKAVLGDPAETLEVIL